MGRKTLGLPFCPPGERHPDSEDFSVGQNVHVTGLFVLLNCSAASGHPAAAKPVSYYFLMIFCCKKKKKRNRLFTSIHRMNLISKSLF